MIGDLAVIGVAHLVERRGKKRRRRRRRQPSTPEARATRARTIRQPPRNLRPPPGTCTLCGAPCEGRRRTWCSKGCVDRWWAATTPRAQRAALRAAYDGCWECRARGVPLDVDHVRPLWSLNAAERHDLKWWELPNLQLLCRGDHGGRCHARKTAREAAQRARARR